MKQPLPKDAEQLLTKLFILIGESLIDNTIENKKDFTSVQDKIGKLLYRYRAEGFTFYEKIKRRKS